MPDTVKPFPYVEKRYDGWCSREDLSWMALITLTKLVVPRAKAIHIKRECCRGPCGRVSEAEKPYNEDRRSLEIADSVRWGDSWLYV